MLKNIFMRKKHKENISKLCSILIVSIVFVLVVVQATFIMKETVKSNSSIVHLIEKDNDKKIYNKNVKIIASAFTPPQDPLILVKNPEIVSCNNNILGNDLDDNSLVDYLTNSGINSNFSERQKIAIEHGIIGYTGTSGENSHLLSILVSEAEQGCGY